MCGVQALQGLSYIPLVSCSHGHVLHTVLHCHLVICFCVVRRWKPVFPVQRCQLQVALRANRCVSSCVWGVSRGLAVVVAVAHIDTDISTQRQTLM